MNPFARRPFDPSPFDLGLEEMTHVEEYIPGWYHHFWRVRFGRIVEIQWRKFECMLNEGPDGVWEVSEPVFIA